MKKGTASAGTVMGILLVLLGFYLLKNGSIAPLPHVCMGAGCILFGLGSGSLISRKALRGDPALQKQMEIDARDERNVAIASRAKAKAYDCMTFLFAALMVTFALMGMPMIPLLMLVFAYLFVHGYAIYYRSRYEKEM